MVIVFEVVQIKALYSISYSTIAAKQLNDYHRPTQGLFSGKHLWQIYEMWLRCLRATTIQKARSKRIKEI